MQQVNIHYESASMARGQLLPSKKVNLTWSGRHMLTWIYWKLYRRAIYQLVFPIL